MQSLTNLLLSTFFASGAFVAFIAICTGNWHQVVTLIICSILAIMLFKEYKQTKL